MRSIFDGLTAEAEKLKSMAASREAAVGR
jgi:hypothetical protein